MSGGVLNLALCPACRKSKCMCNRFPGFQVPRKLGKKRNVDLGKVDVLALGLSEALKPQAPLFKLVAVLRTFVELEPKRLEAGTIES